MATIPKSKPTPTILKVVGCPNVHNLMINQAVYVEGPTPMILPKQLLGIELEIENWRGRGDALEEFCYVEDGSLRNNGKEAITYPMYAKFVEALLTKFYAHHRINENNYSERCSTHIHMNVQDWTFDQLKVFALVYQTVERLLYQYVGHDRKDNIFCVPWYQSGLSHKFISKLSADPNVLLRHWVKYSGLNLLSVREKGTVEFRHMPGTCNVPFIVGWINLISCMSKYAQERTFADVSEDILAMNTVSNYHAFLEGVFQQHTGLLDKGNVRDLLSIGVLDTKLMLVKHKEERFPWEYVDAAMRPAEPNEHDILDEGENPPNQVPPARAINYPRRVIRPLRNPVDANLQFNAAQALVMQNVIMDEVLFDMNNGGNN